MSVQSKFQSLAFVVVIIQGHFLTDILLLSVLISASGE